jgi:hypothetical protein
VDDALVEETVLATVADAPSSSRSGVEAGRAVLVEQKRARIRELAEWDQLDRQQKKTMGLPTTDLEWAKVKGLNARRVAKYRADEYYVSYVEQLRSVSKKRIAPAGSAALTEMMSSTSSGVDDVSDYAAIKTQVAALAKQGDQRALDLWLKHWGKPFLDEETANRVTDLASLSDSDLVSQLVALVNPALLSDVLAGAGWTVAAPCEDVARAHSS